MLFSRNVLLQLFLAVLQNVSATGQARVPQPSAVTVSLLSTSKITVNATFPAGNYTGVSVGIVADGNVVYEGSTTPTPFTIVNAPEEKSFTMPLNKPLTPGSTYTVTVKSMSEEESSDPVQKSITVDALEISDVNKLLIPGSTYTVTVKSISEEESSDPVQKSITVALVAPPSAVTVSILSTSEITVNATFPAGSYDSVYVEIVHRGDGSVVYEGPTTTKPFTIVNATEEKSFTIHLNKPLTPGSTYNVTVKSISEGESSDPVQKSITVALVAPPSAITVSILSPSEITVNVTFPAGSYTGVSVEIVADGNVVYEGLTTPTPFTIVNATEEKSFTMDLNKPLTPGSTYNVTVKSISEGESSDPVQKSITVEKEDGTIEKEDGTIEKEDGTIEKEDGTIEKEDGTIEKEDGTIEKEDGTIDNTGNNKDDDKVLDRKTSSKKTDPDQDSGHFLAYFITVCVICIAGYVIFHNKQKIIAFIVEGRSGRKTKRAKGGNYKLLESNVEEAKSNLDMSMTTKNYIY